MTVSAVFPIENPDVPHTQRRSAAPSTRAIWTGRVLSGLAVAFLSLDTAIKLLVDPHAIAGTAELGYPTGVVPVLGVIELVCLAIYLVPRTSVLGAILWTGYLGGAIATHVRVESPLFTHVLFPTYVAALLWGGLFLRDPRVRALLDRPAPRGR